MNKHKIVFLFDDGIDKLMFTAESEKELIEKIEREIGHKFFIYERATKNNYRSKGVKQMMSGDSFSKCRLKKFNEAALGVSEEVAWLFKPYKENDWTRFYYGQEVPISEKYVTLFDLVYSNTIKFPELKLLEDIQVTDMLLKKYGDYNLFE
ncbi:MAG: hypothetical protein D6B28_10975 [Gammaproteobacteria bacterium]|nr:MAG: hypothetical protein D6B28_10975 [Gammaproteobacteria bacterium]